MFELHELNPHQYPTTPEIDANLKTLLDALNLLRITYNKPMIVTSGLRSEAQQEGLIAAGKSNAHHSKHLIGQAADISDPDGTIKKWVTENEDLLARIGLWCEDFSSTPNWVHFQCVPPKSGKRFFIP